MQKYLAASVVTLAALMFLSVGNACTVQPGAPAATSSDAPTASPSTSTPLPASQPATTHASAVTLTPTAYLPTVGYTPPASRRVNSPYFGNNEVPLSETAIFWFGKVSPTSDYADVRVGYNASELYVRIAVFDRRLWYDATPAPASLTEWDASSLYLRIAGNAGSAPDQSTYRFDAQLNAGETPRTNWQAAYRGNGSSWVVANPSFTTESGFRWESDTVGGVNNNLNNRGWTMIYHIPFSSLGLSGAPTQSTVWGLGVVLHNRDDAANATPIADEKWPGEMNENQPVTWGQLRYGLLTYTRPSASARQTVTVRQGLNGAIVPDAAVGGTTTNLCPGGSNFVWNEWGNANFGGALDFNIQNQSDLADWPCYAKYYVTFPLSQVPANKAIVSATLILHEWGSSAPDDAEVSLIQVLAIAEDWDPATLTWNNAPLAVENVSQSWVAPIPPPGFSGWPGVAYSWDVSLAAAQAYAANQPLRLAFYEADSAYHSGKYFTSSDAEDWDAEGRPTLLITYGTP
jgi:hypothetical protein